MALQDQYNKLQSLGATLSATQDEIGAMKRSYEEVKEKFLRSQQNLQQLVATTRQTESENRRAEAALHLVSMTVAAEVRRADGQNGWGP